MNIFKKLGLVLLVFSGNLLGMKKKSKMQSRFYLFLYTYIISLFTCIQAETSTIEPFKNTPITLAAWIKKCFTKLPEFSHPNIIYTIKNIPSELTIEECTALLNHFIYRFKKDNLFMAQEKWMLGKTPDKNLPTKNTHSFYYKFTQPYVQKLIVPADSCVCFMGDIHGSIHSLLRNLTNLLALGYLDNNFNIIDKNNHPFYMIFTGDYVDRGCWSVEVLHTLMLLKLINFNRVFLLRGNHETESICSSYGLKEELQKKFFPESTVHANKRTMTLATIFDLYCHAFEFLPFALYLGVKEEAGHTSFIQCCHGGIEPFYNPLDFLTSDENISFDLIFQQIPLWPPNNLFTQFSHNFIQNKSPASNWNIGRGFLWGDFEENSQDNSTLAIRFNPQRGTLATLNAADNYLAFINEQLKSKNISLHAFFRGHQHNFFGLKIGNQHWTEVVKATDINEQGFSIAKYAPVFTFSTATEGVNLPCDCFGLLTCTTKYENWRLKPYEHFK